VRSYTWNAQQEEFPLTEESDRTPTNEEMLELEADCSLIVPQEGAK
jgi:hypothetical protein